MVLIKDRRQFARAEVSWPVTLLSPEQHPVGEIKSISQVGASICCQKLPPAGQELGLEIQPPNHQKILVFAKQVWAIDADSSEIPHRFIFGVEFEYISRDDADFLGEVVDAYRQQNN